MPNSPSPDVADGRVDTPEEKERFQSDKKYYRKFRKGIEQQMNENFAASIKNSAAQKDGRQVRTYNSHPVYPTEYDDSGQKT